MKQFQYANLLLAIMAHAQVGNYDMAIELTRAWSEDVDKYLEEFKTKSGTVPGDVLESSEEIKSKINELELHICKLIKETNNFH